MRIITKRTTITRRHVCYNILLWSLINYYIIAIIILLLFDGRTALIKYTYYNNGLKHFKLGVRLTVRLGIWYLAQSVELILLFISEIEYNMDIRELTPRPCKSLKVLLDSAPRSFFFNFNSKSERKFIQTEFQKLNLSCAYRLHCVLAYIIDNL